MELTEHLFRRESGRLVAALTRIFGVHNLALAEDVVQDAFCRALEVWKIRGLPDNPSAWLMTTAKNRALDVDSPRAHGADVRARKWDGCSRREWTTGCRSSTRRSPPHTIRDEQLRMMFSCCHPRLPEDVAGRARPQHPVRLRRAARSPRAFLTSRAAMEKRISRGKKTLASAKRLFDLADADFAARLSAVRRALYLLFNEGYHGASAEAAVRAESVQRSDPADGRCCSRASAGGASRRRTRWPR